MEFDLTHAVLPAVQLPHDYEWVPWNEELTHRHAAVKYASFCSEIDSHVFPALGQAAGCLRLMREIANQQAFLAAGTWLIRYRGDAAFQLPATDCATIQSLRKPKGLAAIQNIGVHPGHRGLGLGRAVLLKTLQGCQEIFLRRVSLEVTAENEPAIQLYRSLGFRITRTMFQQVDGDAVFQPSLAAVP